jgi:hypothetical protein
MDLLVKWYCKNIPLMRPRDEKRSFSTISGSTLANSNSDGKLDEQT